MTLQRICLLLLILVTTACRSEPPAAATMASSSLILPAGEWVDLTHPFDADTIYWPTEKGFQFERGNNGVTAKGYYYAANRFTTAEHGGTHVDAPIHFFDQRQTVDQIELSRLMGEAAVIDVREQCAQDRDYLITVGDLQAWEQKHERQLVDVIVLLQTGWSARWPDREQYLGTAVRGAEAVAQLHFPGLDPQAAQWLVEHRAPKAVGIDTASIDHGPSTHFQAHVTLCEHNVPAFENVANLTQLPAVGSLVVALPMKISGGSGAPLRIIALRPETSR